ncbi:MAG: TrmH family RNA methyltransferase [Candidatus Colwellbacteria bacterium]|nr:TrmH family RNA methyltransferase [Candidatus Colwellbacteria bacterium]
MHNVGSIFRTADAAHIEKIYLCGITPAPKDIFGKFRPQLTKVSLGAEKYVPWEKLKLTSRLIDKFKKDGYKILAVEQSKKSIPYYKLPKSYILNPKSCLVLGGEVNGLPPSILKKADKVLEIPMRGAMVRQAHHPRRSGRGKESLNVAVAFGIVAFSLKYPRLPKV